MKKKTSRVAPCDARAVAGRMAKAQQFYDAAETIREFADDEADVGDAYVTLCVHAGVAAADVICCVSFGQHAQGQDHREAVALLAEVAPDGDELAKRLNTLLGMKTRAGYGSAAVSREDRVRAQRTAKSLLDVARERKSG